MTQPSDVRGAPRRRWLAVAFGGVALAALLLSTVLLPEAVWMVWSVRHGRHAEYSVFQFPVPFAWYAREDFDVLMISRARRVLFDEEPPAMNVFAAVLPNDFLFNYEGWKAGEIRVQSNNGHRLLGAREITVLGQQARCLEFSLEARPDRLRASCFAPAGPLWIVYEGRRADLPVIYAVAEGIIRVH